MSTPVSIDRQEGEALSSPRRVRAWLEGPLIAWGLPLNFLWELAQSPLYTDHSRGLRYLLWTRVHCTVGDVLILLAAFWATAALHRSRRWPHTRGAGAAATFVGLGLAYTAWSEWMNTAVREAWVYAPAMPQIVGVGLAPLLQWLVVPVLLLVLMRRRTPRDEAHVDSRGSG